MQLIPLLISFTSFAQLQIKDKLRTFPRREGFTRNKEKISNLICFGPFVILSKPSLPGQGQDRPTALVIVPNRHSSFSINTPFFVLIVLHLQIVPA